VISGDAVGQQASAADHRYLFRAAFTVDGIENLQKQSATDFRTGACCAVQESGSGLTRKPSWWTGGSGDWG
jgi:hypothetical protein